MSKRNAADKEIKTNGAPKGNKDRPRGNKDGLYFLVRRLYFLLNSKGNKDAQLFLFPSETKIFTRKKDTSFFRFERQRFRETPHNEIKKHQNKHE